MTEDFPLHITGPQVNRLSIDSIREQEAFYAYMEAARDGAPPAVITRLREAWIKACADVSMHVRAILAGHALMVDVLQTGPGVH